MCADVMYEKALKSLRFGGSDDLTRVYFTTFKGSANCSERLEQLKKAFIGGELSYQEHDGLFAISVEGDCCIFFPAEADDASENDFPGCSDEEIQHFYEVVEEKDDFGGWLYKVTDGFYGFYWGCIISDLIDPNFEQQVTMTEVTRKAGNQTTVIHTPKE